MPDEPISYKSSGVDLDAYEQTMALLPRLLKRTYTPRVIEWPRRGSPDCSGSTPTSACFPGPIADP